MKEMAEKALMALVTATGSDGTLIQAYEGNDQPYHVTAEEIVNNQTSQIVYRFPRKDFVGLYFFNQTGKRIASPLMTEKEGVLVDEFCVVLCKARVGTGYKAYVAKEVVLNDEDTEMHVFDIVGVE